MSACRALKTTRLSPPKLRSQLGFGRPSINTQSEHRYGNTLVRPVGPHGWRRAGLGLYAPLGLACRLQTGVDRGCNLI